MNLMIRPINLDCILNNKKHYILDIDDLLQNIFIKLHYFLTIKVFLPNLLVYFSFIFFIL